MASVSNPDSAHDDACSSKSPKDEEVVSSLDIGSPIGAKYGLVFQCEPSFDGFCSNQRELEIGGAL